MPYLTLNRIRQIPYSPEIHPSEFFLFGWLKEKLQQQQFTDPYQRFEALDAVVASLSVDMVGKVFQNLVHRLEQVVAADGDYVQLRFTHSTNTRLGWPEGS
jgi:hypothetical protein